MTPGLKSAMSLGLSALALIGFAVIYVYAIIESLSGDPSSTLTRPNFVFLANALAGLVGSVVAAGFGQTLPPPPQANVAGGGNAPTAAGGVGNIVDAGNVLPSGLSAYIAGGYAIVYIAVGIAAIVVWAVADVPEIVNNLAGVVLGLGVAILQATLNRVPS
jgi:hypothetical protein